MFFQFFVIFNGRYFEKYYMYMCTSKCFLNCINFYISINIVKNTSGWGLNNPLQKCVFHCLLYYVKYLFGFNEYYASETYQYVYVLGSSNQQVVTFLDIPISKCDYYLIFMQSKLYAYQEHWCIYGEGSIRGISPFQDLLFCLIHTLF